MKVCNFFFITTITAYFLSVDDKIQFYDLLVFVLFVFSDTIYNIFTST